MRKNLLAAAAILIAMPAIPALAQQGLATSSTIGGHNTIQQAPSGGTDGRPTGGGPGAPGNSDQPTPQERQVEQRNDAATQICKGC